MSDYLGWLCRWHVADETRVTEAHVGQVCAELGITPPKATLEVNVFRKLRDIREVHRDPDGREVILELFLSQSRDPKKRQNHHIVRTVRMARVNESVTKVGDVAFIKGNRNQPLEKRKVRLVIQATSDDPRVRAYVQRLRAEYRAGQGAHDDQAIRRLVRKHLATVEAVIVDDGGLWLVPSEVEAERLITLVHRLGGRAWTLPIVDDEPRRQMLAEWNQRRTHHADEQG